MHRPALPSPARAGPRISHHPFALGPSSGACGRHRGLVLDSLEKWRSTFFRILPHSIDVKFPLNRGDLRAAHISLDCIATMAGPSPCQFKARTLTRVHLQDRFVGLCVPLVLSRQGTLRSSPLRLPCERQRRPSRGSGVHHKGMGRPSATSSLNNGNCATWRLPGSLKRQHTADLTSHDLFTRCVHMP